MLAQIKWLNLIYKVIGFFIIYYCAWCVMATEIAGSTVISDCQKKFSNSDKSSVIKQGSLLKKDHITSIEIQLLFSDPENFKKYSGKKGHILFSEIYFKGKMRTAFKRVFTVLSKRDFQKLSWKDSYGTVSDIIYLKNMVLDKEGNPLEKYIGVEGYVRLAKEHFKGNMLITFRKVSGALGKMVFTKLGWQCFYGNTKQVNDLFSILIGNDGIIVDSYKGMDGYIALANEYFDGVMGKTFINVSAILDKSQFKQLGWRVFYGTVGDFQQLRSKLVDKKGHIKEEYKEMQGMALFADEYYKGRMASVLSNVSTVLTKDEVRELGWKSFNGLTKDFYRIKSLVLDKNGQPKKQYIGIEGYILFADEYYEGNMYLSFTLVSAVFNRFEFKKFQWRMFRGKTWELNHLKRQIMDESGEVLNKYKDQLGHALYAEEHVDGNMQKAYINVSVLLGKDVFKSLGWKAFQGTSESFYKIRNRIMDKNNLIRNEYIGMDGYLLFAEEYYDGGLQKAFNNVSAVLSKKEFVRLRWKVFFGTVKKFKDIRSDVIIEHENSWILRPEYKDMNGYILFADRYFRGNMRDAAAAISAVLGRELWTLLGWKVFLGTTYQLRLLMEDLKANYPSGWIRLAGQRRIADRIFKGSGHDTYYNVLSIKKYLSDKENTFDFSSLGWDIHIDIRY